jgi:hypothetical protein
MRKGSASSTGREGARVDDGDVDAVALQQVERAARGVHAAHARRDVQQRHDRL